MFHLFHGTISTIEETTYLENEQWGIEVIYEGKQQSGKFFLIPQLDMRSGVIKYYAFELAFQKALFQNFTKIQGVGGRTAYMLAMRDHAELDAAIERFDLNYFSAIP
jgi:Holliday junction resolvasome RuvABC DNA-binding subunit